MRTIPKVGDAVVEVHADLGAFKRELQAAGRGVSREIDVKADTSSLKGFNTELSKTSKSMTTTSKDADRAGDSISNFTKRVVTANQGLDLLGKGTALIKWPALISGASYAAQAVNNLAAGASALTGALTPSQGSRQRLLPYTARWVRRPGWLRSLEFPTFAGAVGGLNEKMDKTADEYKQLSAEGQKFARVLNQQKQPLQDIQKAVQRPLFEGMTKGIQSASKNLPVLKSVLVATSEEMGRLAEEAGRFAGREGFGRDMEAVGKNNAQLLGRLGDAGLHFADALRHVMVEAQPLVDFLGKSVLKFSEFVEEEAKAGRESGKLRDFFKETKDLLKVLVPTFADLGEGIWNVVRAGKPLGDDILGVLRDSAEEFRKWSESASGKNAIVEWYDQARNPLEQTAKLVRDIGELFFDIGSGGGLGKLIKQIRKEMLPVLEDVLKAGRGFGPTFVDFVTEATHALKPFLGASGPLTLLVKGATTLLKLFNKLVEVVPELGTALATVVGAGAISKLFGGKGVLGGKGGIMGLLGGALGLGGAGLLGGGGGAAARGAGGAGGSIFGSVLGGAAGGAAAGEAAGGLAGLTGKFKTWFSGLSKWAKIGGIGTGITFATELWKGFDDRSAEAAKKLGPRLQGFMDRSIGNLEFTGRFDFGDDIQAALERVPLIGPAVSIFGSASSEKEAAEDLNKAVRTIAGNQRTLTAEQAETLRGRADELDLTEKMRQEVQGLIHDARIAGRIELLPTTIGDKGAQQLRQIVRDARNAGQEIERSQVKAWVRSGKIGVEEGARLINQIENVEQKARSVQRSRWVQEGLGLGQAMTKDRQVTKTELQNIAQQLALVPEKYDRAAGKATIAWAKEERRKGNITKTEFRDIVRTVENQVGNITQKQQRGMNKQVSNQEEGWGSITSIVHDGYDYVKRQTDKAAKGLGAGKAPKWTVDAPGPLEGGGSRPGGQRGLLVKPAELAMGGLAATVPGRPAGDTHLLSIDGVPQARVEGTEGIFVGNSKMMRAAAAANAMYPRFATGGVLQPPGDPGSEVVQAAYASEVGNFLRRFGMDLTQGYNPGGPSVSPGHLSLDAAPSLDVVPLDGNWDGLFAQGLRWALSQGMQVGYDGQYGTQSWPDHGEGNHAHIDWKSGGRLGAVVEKIKALIVEGPEGARKEIAQAGINKVTSWANEKLSKMAPAADTTGIGLVGGSAAENQQLGRQMLLQTPGVRGPMRWGPWGASEWPPYDRLIQSESGWSTTATNPSSGAYGIPQSLPPGKMAAAGSDWRTNAATQIAWGLDYIKEVYGAPSATPLGGYLRGGLLRLRGGGPLKRARKGTQLNVSGASTAGVNQPINIEDLEFDPAALAAGAVKGHGGESPSTPLFTPPRGEPGDWFQMMFGTEPVRKMKDIVGGIGLRPDRFKHMADLYSGPGGALDADEYATVAQALETEDPITGAISYPPVDGRVAIGGLGADVGQGWMDVELAKLIEIRDRIQVAIPIVGVLTKFVKAKADALVGGQESFLFRAKQLYNQAKRAYDNLKRRIGDLETQIQRLEGIKNPSDEQKKRLEQHKTKLQGFKALLPTLGVWMDAAKFRVGAVGDVETAFTEKGTALAGLTTQLKVDGAEDGSWPSLEELQGRTGRAGTIFDVKLEIDSALRAAGEAAAAAAADAAGEGGGEVSDAESQRLGIVEQQLIEERQRRLVAESQLPVFEQFFGRTFHSGGIIGGSGDQAVLAQGGEGVFTEEQMAAMGSSNVTVVVEDGAVDPNRIRVVVDDRLGEVAAASTRVGGVRGQKSLRTRR